MLRLSRTVRSMSDQVIIDLGKLFKGPTSATIAGISTWSLFLKKALFI
jgi:hypothetical protein